MGKLGLGWRIAATVCLTGSIVGGAALASSARTGEIKPFDCYASNTAINHCVGTASGALSFTQGVAVSSDGKDVFVVSSIPGSVAHFERRSTSDLRYSDCQNQGGTNGCGAPVIPRLAGADAVAASPTGPIYVAAGDDGALNRFLLSDGHLLAQGSLHSPPGDVLEGIDAVAVSPKGDSVYMTGGDHDTLVSTQDTKDNVFGHVHPCYSSDTGAEPACAAVPHDALDGADGVAVSSDGKSVYAVGATSGALTWFKRKANGNLTYGHCYAGSGCSALSNFGSLAGASDVAVSPDSKSVYVTAADSDSVSVFKRRSSGALAYSRCFAESTASGCSVPGDAALNGANSVVVSPDSNSVHVTAKTDEAITQFTRGADGHLTYHQCYASETTDGCKEMVNGNISQLESTALSPDGRSLYAASNIYVDAFHRKADRCQGKPVTAWGTASADKIHGTKGNDVIDGQGGADRINGRGGNDAICGEAGNDHIDGGPGRDKCSGGPGHDVVRNCERGH